MIPNPFVVRLPDANAPSSLLAGRRFAARRPIRNTGRRAFSPRPRGSVRARVSRPTISVIPSPIPKPTLIVTPTAAASSTPSHLQRSRLSVSTVVDSGATATSTSPPSSSLSTQTKSTQPQQQQLSIRQKEQLGYYVPLTQLYPSLRLSDAHRKRAHSARKRRGGIGGGGGASDHLDLTMRKDSDKSLNLELVLRELRYVKSQREHLRLDRVGSGGNGGNGGGESSEKEDELGLREADLLRYEDLIRRAVALRAGSSSTSPTLTNSGRRRNGHNHRNRRHRRRRGERRTKRRLLTYPYGFDPSSLRPASLGNADIKRVAETMMRTRRHPPSSGRSRSVEIDRMEHTESVRKQVRFDEEYRRFLSRVESEKNKRKKLSIQDVQWTLAVERLDPEIVGRKLRVSQSYGVAAAGHGNVSPSSSVDDVDVQKKVQRTRNVEEVRAWKRRVSKVKKVWQWPRIFAQLLQKKRDAFDLIEKQSRQVEVSILNEMEAMRPEEEISFSTPAPPTPTPPPSAADTTSISTDATADVLPSSSSPPVVMNSYGPTAAMFLTSFCRDIGGKLRKYEQVVSAAHPDRDVLHLDFSRLVESEPTTTRPPRRRSHSMSRYIDDDDSATVTATVKKKEKQNPLVKQLLDRAVPSLSVSNSSSRASTPLSVREEVPCPILDSSFDEDALKKKHLLEQHEMGSFLNINVEEVDAQLARIRSNSPNPPSPVPPPVVVEEEELSPIFGSRKRRRKNQKGFNRNHRLNPTELDSADVLFGTASLDCSCVDESLDLASPPSTDDCLVLAASPRSHRTLPTLDDDDDSIISFEEEEEEEGENENDTVMIGTSTPNHAAVPGSDAFFTSMVEQYETAMDHYAESLRLDAKAKKEGRKGKGKGKGQEGDLLSDSAAANVKKEIEVILEEEVASGAYGSVHRGVMSIVKKRLGSSDEEEEEEEDDIMDSNQHGGVMTASRLPIAVKKISVNPRLHGSSSERVVRVEIEIFRKLRSDFLIRYFGCSYSRTRREYSILMEWMDRGTLLQAIRRRSRTREPYTELQVSQVLAHLLRGLQTLHTMKIVHRDLKSSNVLVNSAGSVKIADFGASALLGRLGSTRNSCVGTPGFASPEVLKAEKHSLETDIWSLGCVLLHLFTLRHPFDEFKGFTIAIELDNLDIPSYVDRCMPSYSQRARDFVLLCLKKDPSRRPPIEALLQHDFPSKEVVPCSFLSE